MKIIQSPVDKYFSTNDPAVWVEHTTLGTSAESSIEWLRRPHVEGSYHFIIDEDGTIHQLVPLDKGAWGAGRWNKPTLRARTLFGNKKINTNAVQCAYSRKHHPRLTKEQVSSGVWLKKFVGKKTGYRYTLDNTIEHWQIAADKPREVTTYMNQVMDELIGEKDEKDSEQRTKLKMVIQLLMIKLELLLKQRGDKHYA